ncbi:MAG: RelA/SpoT domain-containing protein [Proteobacteria bacterium]|nr:GTP pyrophosphokinase [Desulfobacula sp.]MBU4130298.1 RelA/SpoT domain-containing protein [Pseudomonadota bacterium]
MRKRQKEAILVAFLREKEKYEKLAEYIVQFIRDDPSSPKENLHTILYRIKEKKRLIEKIDEENKRVGDGVSPISQKNFQAKIDDLLGIRLICLRLSDIDRVKAYLGLLADEKIIRFIRNPDHKRSFVLPVDPGETIPEGLHLRYSGYSSIHYQIALGENSDAPDELKKLQVEFQLRTILEEAWGEIDHKYRYAFSRSGVALPEHIHTGFYNLSAYLQAAALQAEHLCRQTEAFQLLVARKTKAKHIPKEKSIPTTLPPTFPDLMELTFGFKPTVRTIIYLLKRLDEVGYAEQPQTVFKKVFTQERLQEFRTIFKEVLNREPFKDKNKRNVDAINAVNFALSYEIQGNRVAMEGLRSILGRKKKRSR